MSERVRLPCVCVYVRVWVCVCCTFGWSDWGGSSRRAYSKVCLAATIDNVIIQEAFHSYVSRVRARVPGVCACVRVCARVCPGLELYETLYFVLVFKKTANTELVF